MYYVITKNATFVALTTESPYEWNLPGVSIHKFNSDLIPDLNKSTWDDLTETFVRSSAILTKLEFMNLFTQAERISITNSSDLLIKDFVSLLSIAEYINKNDPNTIAAINYLVVQGHITSTRSTEILT